MLIFLIENIKLYNTFRNKLKYFAIQMKIKLSLLILIIVLSIFGMIYYLTSPYQTCLRTINKKIGEFRNRLAVETDVSIREKLEIDQKEYLHEKEFGCFEKNRW